MKIINNANGMSDSPYIFGLETVYVHENITEQVDENGNITYSYDETQMTYNEFSSYIAERQRKSEEANEAISEVLDALLMGDIDL